jgi:hypothetical protein
MICLKWWYFPLFLTFFHFIKCLIERIKWLTVKTPTIPIGVKRKATFGKQTKVEIDLSDYYNIFFAFFSIFIVPYESQVLFIDEMLRQKTPSADKANYVLSYQEKQHSLLHEKLNQIIFKSNPELFVKIMNAFRVFSETITKMLLKYSNAVSGMVAIFENGFYYLYGTEGLFKVFNKNSIFSKIFLWHFYEEIEHNQETTFLFIVHHQHFRFIYAIVGYFLYLFLNLTIQIFVVASIILCSPWKAKPILILDSINNYCKYAGIGFLSVILLFFKLNSDPTIIQEDLDNFDNLFQKKFNFSLNQENIRFD